MRRRGTVEITLHKEQPHGLWTALSNGPSAPDGLRIELDWRRGAGTDEEEQDDARQANDEGITVSSASVAATGSVGQYVEQVTALPTKARMLEGLIVRAVRELDEGRPCGTRDWHRLHAGVSSQAEVVVCRLLSDVGDG